MVLSVGIGLTTSLLKAVAPKIVVDTYQSMTARTPEEERVRDTPPRLSSGASLPFCGGQPQPASAR